MAKKKKTQMRNLSSEESVFLGLYYKLLDDKVSDSRINFFDVRINNVKEMWAQWIFDRNVRT